MLGTPARSFDCGADSNTVGDECARPFGTRMSSRKVDPQTLLFTIESLARRRGGLDPSCLAISPSTDRRRFRSSMFRVNGWRKLFIGANCHLGSVIGQPDVDRIALLQLFWRGTRIFKKKGILACLSR
jgi:hypothetical protein